MAARLRVTADARLVAAHEFFRNGQANAEGWSMLVGKGRDWESPYRDRWRHDKVCAPRTACSPSCSQPPPPRWCRSPSPASPWPSLGLGTGAVVKLVPERFPDRVGAITGVVGGLGGFFPPRQGHRQIRHRRATRSGSLMALVAVACLMVLGALRVPQAAVRPRDAVPTGR